MDLRDGDVVVLKVFGNVRGPFRSEFFVLAENFPNFFPGGLGIFIGREEGVCVRAVKVTY